MSNYFYGAQQQQQHHHTQNPHPMAVNNHHGRSRRALRISSNQTGNRQYRHQQKNMMTREPIVTEPPSITAFRARFEAGRSFDLDDDLEFCPSLLSFDERQSVTSGSSDRSSLSSISPESSPLQQQIQPQVAPALSIPNAAASYISPPTTFANNTLKIHQPAAIRSRNNAIPIVNPSTGNRIASPPSSISPGMMQQTTAARRW